MPLHLAKIIFSGWFVCHERRKQRRQRKKHTHTENYSANHRPMWPNQPTIYRTTIKSGILATCKEKRERARRRCRDGIVAIFNKRNHVQDKLLSRRKQFTEVYPPSWNLCQSICYTYLIFLFRRNCQKWFHIFFPAWNSLWNSWYCFLHRFKQFFCILFTIESSIWFRREREKSTV